MDWTLVNKSFLILIAILYNNKLLWRICSAFFCHCLTLTNLMDKGHSQYKTKTKKKKVLYLKIQMSRKCLCVPDNISGMKWILLLFLGYIGLKKILKNYCPDINKIFLFLQISANVSLFPLSAWSRECVFRIWARCWCHAMIQTWYMADGTWRLDHVSHL